jgi:hypothetical protein
MGAQGGRGRSKIYGRAKAKPRFAGIVKVVL